MTPEQRLAAFRKMADERPRDPFARYSLAMALRAAGREAEAVREFEELRRGSPEYLPTYLMLGQALEGLGRRDEAARAYAEGVEAAARAGDGHAGGELAQALEALRAQAS